MFLRRPKPVRRPTELLIGIGFFVAVAACAATALLVPDTLVEVRFAVMGLAACLYAVVAADLWAAAVTGILAWTLATGFLTHPVGELSVTGGSDAIRLFAIMGLSVAGGLYGVLRRRTA
ncbi:unnamed protein product [[Actinomadura] parvosata subsp. kistnae]|uniref:Histidine kinase n=1 Tax=[Actinomadura] parvosata subsp. kistnae TaxID=1909395 RepID=A0A1V0AH83_9ACTN|nr:hypothetical protein [Nonomuraea sp. ATCC 55076]AQZ69566.1 hypothetical protein BKM31_56100 [Nonomuraea sp. ATCC 55076]SPL91751.1 unnamed protein product [Actinomadura parvosata subsp. kistnae]